MVNLVGGLYPGLYDWGVEVERPGLKPGVCLTSEVIVRVVVVADVLESTVDVTSDCVLVRVAVAGPVDTTARAMVCWIMVHDRVQATSLEGQATVTGEIAVQELETPAILGPTVVADVEVRVLVTAALDCTPVPVTADVDARALVIADDELGCCCLEASHE